MTKFPPGMYRMRNGERAEVFAERDGELWGRRQLNSEVWSLWRWVVDGTEANGCQHKFDLISPWVEAEKPFECWVNRYWGEDECCGYQSKELADRWRSSKCYGTVTRMIEATPITTAAGDLYKVLTDLLDSAAEGDPRHFNPSHRQYAAIVATLAKAEGRTP